MGWLEHGRYLRALQEESEGIARTVEGADLSAKVPTCPDWELHQLVGHVGRAFSWATEIVARREDPELDPFKIAEPELPQERDAVPGWTVERAGALAELLTGTGADTPCWSWGEAQRTGFWARRMAHEALVHRYDAALAAGRQEAYTADPELAADNVTEFLANSTTPAAAQYNPRLQKLRGKGETVHLHATDAEQGEWLLRLEPDGFRCEPGHEKADTAVRGTAQSLMLLINRRLPDWKERPELERFGDPALLDFWLEQLAFD